MSAELIDFLRTVEAKLDQAEQAPKAKTPIIGNCHNCGRYLPWPSPRPGAWVAPVACPECKRWYYCESRNGSTFAPPDAQATRTSGLASVSGVYRPQESEAVATVRDSLIGDSVYLGPERRGATRAPVSSAVVVAPLDECFAPLAMAQRMTLIDFSIHGAGLMGRPMIESECVLIDFSESCFKDAQIIARLVDRQQLDDNMKYGCEFVADVGEL